MKKGNNYLKTDPWRIIEEGFHPQEDQVSESIFSLANEYLGVRGYFDEGYSGDSLLGSYVNGIYEYDRKPKPQYRGITANTNFMLNCDDWLYTRIWINNEQLDLATSRISNFKRILDMTSGEMKRSFTWHLKDGVDVSVSFTRLLSNIDERFAYQHIKISPNSDCQLTLISGINFNTVHGKYQHSFWKEFNNYTEKNNVGIICETISTKQKLKTMFNYQISNTSDATVTNQHENKLVSVRINSRLTADNSFDFNKTVLHDRSNADISTLLKDLNTNVITSFKDHKLQQKKFWKGQWKKYDIKIDGDEKNQQGIRYCIFQLLQTYRGLSPMDNIGAKGLTGEVYNGHCYWETETVVFPFYLFNNIKAAKQLLDYRYRTLPQAKERAKMIDCKGASYPLATLNGEEGNDYWQHANTQLQPSTAVAYAIWHYTNVTKDHSFEKTKGIEMLVEISRFLYSRGDYGQSSHRYGFYGVMGPDEFQLMVNHDAYTNLMGRFTFNYTVRLLKELKQENPSSYEVLCSKQKVNDNEINDWQEAANRMLIHQTDEGLIEQHQGYFDLPHVDISKIKQSQYPLYDHWSYDRLFRNDMIKQPDVLMYQFMFATKFSKHSKQINYDYYDARTVHESSLSPSIHSILAEELDYENDARRLFEFATRLDLDNYNNNTDAGLHMTSISAAWLNIIYGFGGLRSDGNILELSPKLPKLWEGYSFKITYLGNLIEIHRTKNELTIKSDGPMDFTVKIFNKTMNLEKNKQYKITLMKEKINE